MLGNSIAASIYEYLFDGARSVLYLIMSGTACRIEGVRWSTSHCGGVLRSLVDWMFLFMHFEQSLTASRYSIVLAKQQIVDLRTRQFWVDLAGNPTPAHRRADKIYGQRALIFR